MMTMSVRKSFLLIAVLIGLTGLSASADDGASKIWSVGFTSEIFAGYQWHNHVSNPEGAIQGTLSGEITLPGPFSLGGYIWENYDLTDRRRASYATALTETDFGLNLGYAAWTSDDENYALAFEFGHDWITYHNRVGRTDANPNTRELYAKGVFTTPLVTPYAQVNWMYEDFGDYHAGFNYEIGLIREIALTDRLTAGAKVNLGFENRPYQQFLFGTSTSGLTGSTLRLYSRYALSDYLSIRATLAYTGLINSDARDELKHTSYKRDLLWGALALVLAF